MWQTKGQDNALALIENEIQTGNLPHAYLLVGPAHIGKTTLALDIARVINCQGVSPPCSECPSCSRIASGRHTDVMLIALDQSLTRSKSEMAAHSEISIKEIQELQKRASLPPFEGKYKVFIINGAENLSTEAANCLLKILEEPPQQVIIILLTTDESKLLPTVVSRCQRIELRPLSSNKVAEMLINSFDMEIDKARILSRLSEGCLGQALVSFTDNKWLEQRSQRLGELFSIIKETYYERFSYVAQIDNSRKATEQLLKSWLSWWRDVILMKCGCEQAVINLDSISIAREWAHAFELEELTNFVDSLLQALDQISKNVNGRLVMEILMLNMPVMKVEGQQSRTVPGNT